MRYLAFQFRLFCVDKHNIIKYTSQWSYTYTMLGGMRTYNTQKKNAYKLSILRIGIKPFSKSIIFGILNLCHNISVLLYKEKKGTTKIITTTHTNDGLRRI